MCMKLTTLHHLHVHVCTCTSGVPALLLHFLLSWQKSRMGNHMQPMWYINTPCVSKLQTQAEDTHAAPLSGVHGGVWANCCFQHWKVSSALRWSSQHVQYCTTSADVSHSTHWFAIKAYMETGMHLAGILLIVLQLWVISVTFLPVKGTWHLTFEQVP